LDALSALRIISPQQGSSHDGFKAPPNGKRKLFVKLNFPMNFVTAPLIADLFLLAILAIGRHEVRGGTLGTDNIAPYDIMLFFVSLAYIAISIDASGLIRYLAFKVLQWGGDAGHRLFFYLYAFFFGLATFIGNDPIILSGTAFLAYMTRVSSNIVHPSAWIHTQFAVANIASAILVSSNPTNLVLAGAFNIKFINYTANIIVPVIVTAIVLFPFLLYIVFNDETLIPSSIHIHDLPEELRTKTPVNPNIPHARGIAEEEENLANTEKEQLLSLEEIMNPFLDKGGAAFGGVVMGVTLITLLAVNAGSEKFGHVAAYWVTLPGAVVMLCWDIGFGWYHRQETRDIAHKGREAVELHRAERAIRDAEKVGQVTSGSEKPALDSADSPEPLVKGKEISVPGGDDSDISTCTPQVPLDPSPSEDLEEKQRELEFQERISQQVELRKAPHGRATLVSLVTDAYHWLQETFPTATTVTAHLPIALVPFAFSMFVLVQALVTKGKIMLACLFLT
jgi:Na+/H+ antiporter NhaD/arsenite permease-like protein